MSARSPDKGDKTMRGKKIILRCFPFPGDDDVFVGRIWNENDVAYFVVSEDEYKKLEQGEPSAREPMCGHLKEYVYLFDEEWLKSDKRTWENLTPIQA